MINETKSSSDWDNITLANNYIFYLVMKNNPDLCKELLEILLEIEIDSIHIVQEDSIIVDMDSKSVRLDVYAKNSTQSFDLEMQTTNTKELQKRARYYQGIIDVDNLKIGQKYRELKDSYIIFICLDDVFNEGLPVYSFENICRENKEIVLDDKAYKYFFIANNCDKILNEKQKAFLKLITSNVATDDFTKQLLSKVQNAKKNTQWRYNYMMTYERQRAYDIELGEERKAVEAALIMIKEFNLTPELAAQKLNAPLEKVLEALKK